MMTSLSWNIHALRDALQANQTLSDEVRVERICRYACIDSSSAAFKGLGFVHACWHRRTFSALFFGQTE